jgi:hypothetical protein
MESAMKSPLACVMLLLLGFITLGRIAGAVGQCEGQWAGEWRADGAVTALLVADLDGAGGSDPVLVVGGGFGYVDGVESANVALWDGSEWESTGGISIFGPSPGLGVAPLSFAVFRGDLYAGIQTSMPGRGVQCWTNRRWKTVGSNGPTGAVRALLEHEGELFAAGDFGVMAWDGRVWRQLGTDFVRGVNALIQHDRALIAAGDRTVFPPPVDGGELATTVARWDGESWRPIGGNSLTANIGTLTVYQGDLVAGGNESALGSRYVFARLNGQSWSSLGTIGVPGDPLAIPSGVLQDMCVHDGALYATGALRFPQGQYLIRWDGTAWRTVQTRLRNWGTALASYRGQLVIGSTGGYTMLSLDRWSSPSADFDHDGNAGTDADIEAFFECLSGRCCGTCGSADVNGDGDVGTDADIEAFLRMVEGGAC